MSGNNSDDDVLEAPKKMSGQADSKHANMKPEERDAMVEWLGMDREGQKDGQPMKNWRCIYGGAAKGRNMNEEAGEVHSSGGYERLAAFVNSKCKIKSDKRRAWDAEIAEKRWTDLKKKYKIATRMEEPLNTVYDSDDTYGKAKEKFEEAREKCCRDYLTIHEMLKEHPGIHPYQPADSMRSGADEEPPMLAKKDTMGLKKRSNPEEGGPAAKKKTKKKKEKKPEFHLRKPDAPVSTGKQRMNIHQMFIETQQKQVDLDKQKILVDAIGKLAASGIQPQNMQPYLQLMGLAPPPLPLPAPPAAKVQEVSSSSSDDSGSSDGSEEEDGA